MKLRRALVALLASVMLVSTAVGVQGAAASTASSTAQAAGRTYTIGPTGRDGLSLAIRTLRPGDTLRLNPGTYDVGGFKPPMASGTAAAPIRLTAADPRRPPEIRGQLVFEGADYWEISRIKVVATVPRQPGLKMSGGTGWVVDNSEIYGAAQTVVHANVVIDSNRTNRTPPTNWRFTNNCVHDAARRPSGDTAGYHNIYVTTEWGGRGGVIGHNVLYNAPGGANIKVGTGGNAVLRGASGILIEYNSMYNANQQVLLFGNLSDIVVRRNLFVRSHGASVSTGQYLSHLKNDGKVKVITADNYGSQMQRPTFVLNSSTKSYVDRGNILGADPRATVGCGRFQPTTKAAQAYGWWAGR